MLFGGVPWVLEHIPTAMADEGGIDLSSIIGPVYWGFVMSLVLGGICVLQAYIYFMHTRDTSIIQLAAGIMISLDFVSSGLVAQAIYYYLIPHFGSLKPLGEFTITLSVDCLFSTVITFISQLFLARQVYFVTKSKRKSVFIPGLVAFSAFCAFAFGIACTAAMIVFRRAVLGERDPKFVLFFGLQKGFSAITDIIATAALFSHLSASKTGINQTNSLIRTLMEYTIQRGALVTLIQTVLVITYFAAPKHVYWLPVHINLTKLYSNVFFAILNARSSLNERYGGTGFAAPNMKLGPIQHQETFRLSTIHDNEKTMPMVTKSVIVSDI